MTDSVFPDPFEEVASIRDQLEEHSQYFSERIQLLDRDIAFHNGQAKISRAMMWMFLTIGALSLLNIFAFGNFLWLGLVLLSFDVIGVGVLVWMMVRSRRHKYDWCADPDAVEARAKRS